MSQRQIQMESMMRLHVEENDFLRKKLMISYDNEIILNEMNKQLTSELEATKAELDQVKSELRETAEHTE